VGEFMMFNGLFKYNIWYAAIAGLGVILAAIYTLNMIARVFYGRTNTLTEKFIEIRFNEKLVLCILVVFVFVLGIYPKPLFDLVKESVEYFSLRIP
jgi:NADH-quinone oxidoreductase subunit M